MKDRLLAKLEDRSACLGIVGLGYVGLPLALEFAKAGFRVIGYDVSDRVVKSLMAGESHIQDVSSEELAAVVKSGKLRGDRRTSRASARWTRSRSRFRRRWRRPAIPT